MRSRSDSVQRSKSGFLTFWSGPGYRFARLKLRQNVLIAWLRNVMSIGRILKKVTVKVRSPKVKKVKFDI